MPGLVGVGVGGWSGKNEEGGRGRKRTMVVPPVQAEKKTLKLYNVKEARLNEHEVGDWNIMVDVAALWDPMKRRRSKRRRRQERMLRLGKKR